MEVLKTAIDWARAEIFSSAFFILFGIFFLLASAGFWQMGKTDLARAFIVPTLVAGVLLLTIGIGLVYSNKTRLASFPAAWESDPAAFVAGEIERVENTMKEYETVVFRVIPFIVIAAALAFVFIDRPSWRAISITTIAMMTVIMAVDSNAHARLKVYHQRLSEVREMEK